MSAYCLTLKFISVLSTIKLIDNLIKRKTKDTESPCKLMKDLTGTYCCI